MLRASATIVAAAVLCGRGSSVRQVTARPPSPKDLTIFGPDACGSVPHTKTNLAIIRGEGFIDCGEEPATTQAEVDRHRHDCGTEQLVLSNGRFYGCLKPTPAPPDTAPAGG